MFKFNAGAPRRAGDDARAKQMDAANDLVRRTLAQHGLMPAATGTDGDGVSSDIMATVQNALSQAGLSGGTSTPSPITVPPGAEFRHDTYTGTGGTRAFRTYIPATVTDGAATGIVMMLHGCTQNPEDFAIGTGMNALADTHGFVVIYPEQSRGANAQTCWNWFSPNDQKRGRGEPAILAGIAQGAMREFEVVRDRTFVAGLSAGAAMAVILGETYPDTFAAIGAHSGLAFGAAVDVASAFAAMAGTGSARVAVASKPSDLRSIVFHGDADATVQRSNSDDIARQVEARAPSQTMQLIQPGQSGGRKYERAVTTATNGTALLEQWTIESLGHAWSGGQPGGSYTDPKGPDASAEMIRFFYETTHKDT